MIITHIPSNKRENSSMELNSQQNKNNEVKTEETKQLEIDKEMSLFDEFLFKDDERIEE